jgi:hypothetical protein
MPQTLRWLHWLEGRLMMCWQIAVAFLRAGWAVRGTVRSTASALPLLNALRAQSLDAAFKIVEVPDITARGAFDDAVKGKL